MCEKILRINRMKYMLFASWEVWIGENCARGIEVSQLKVNSNFLFWSCESLHVSLLPAMTCVNLVFPPQKLNSDGALSHWIPSVSVMQFTVKMSKLNGRVVQIYFETNIVLSTKVNREREKRWLMSYLSAWVSNRRLCLKIPPSRKNEIHLWKMAAKVGMYSATHESVTRLQNSLPCPLRKKLRKLCKARRIIA